MKSLRLKAATKRKKGDMKREGKIRKREKPDYLVFEKGTMSLDSTVEVVIHFASPHL